MYRKTIYPPRLLLENNSGENCSILIMAVQEQHANFSFAVQYSTVTLVQYLITINNVLLSYFKLPC